MRQMIICFFLVSKFSYKDINEKIWLTLLLEDGEFANIICYLIGCKVSFLYSNAVLCKQMKGFVHSDLLITWNS